MPSDQESSPAILEKHLLHPVNLKAAEVLKAGGSITPPNELALKVRWSPNQAKFIHEQLTAWLTTGDTNKLIKLLEKEPTAIAHQSIFWQLFHLSGLLRQIDEDDVKDFDEHRASYDDDQPVLSSGIKPLAKEFLLKLLSAWVSRMLPSHVVTPLKFFRRHGRNAKWSTDERIMILTEFGELSTALNEIEEAGPAEVAIKKKESRAKFLKRMETVVQRLNTYTLEYWAASIKTPATMTKGAVLKKKPPFLPNAVASKIVRQAVPDKRLSKNKLLYGILAHHYLRDCRKIESMRGLIEHGEADFPELDRRRRSHSTLALKSKK